MQLTILAAGIGGRTLADTLRHHGPTVIGSTAEDITLCGLRLCPDLDGLMEVLGTVEPSPAAGSHRVADALRRYDAAPEWYPIDDETFARSIARSRWLGLGIGLSEVTARLAGDLGAARLLPMSDEPVEAHVVVEAVPTGATSPDDPEQHAVHALEWAARREGRVVRTTAAGLRSARPAPGVLDAIRSADLVVLGLTAPLTGLGVMVALPGLRDALRGTSAPVVGVSPSLLPARGDEEALLEPLDLAATSDDVGGLFADVLDGYLVPDGDAERCRGGRWRDVLVHETAPGDRGNPGEHAALDGGILRLAEQLGVSS